MLSNDQFRALLATTSRPPEPPASSASRMPPREPWRAPAPPVVLPKACTVDVRLSVADDGHVATTLTPRSRWASGGYVLGPQHLRSDECDHVAINPLVDAWIETDTAKVRQPIQDYYLAKDSKKTTCKSLRGDWVPVSLARAVFDNSSEPLMVEVRSSDERRQAQAACELAFHTSPLHSDWEPWHLGTAQLAAALIARVVEPYQRIGSAPPAYLRSAGLGSKVSTCE